ncbi:IS66 family transposase zinc-finger binding domain-containing protein [Paraglaciecola sp.]|uniref:IS66 family transposase zinc-finger binding domain-containing protein n=1 Tax=Paraglaciecola sp. TaxID=1920173 RepID=UPI003266A0CD
MWHVSAMNEHDYQQRILELEKQVNKLESRNQFQEEQFRLAQQQRFGVSSEGRPGQGELFNETEEIVEDRAEKLEFIPAQVKVIEHVRPKYACRVCEKEGTKNHIKQALGPPSVIPKGYATPCLLSHIITSKCQFGYSCIAKKPCLKIGH